MSQKLIDQYLVQKEGKYTDKYADKKGQTLNIMKRKRHQKRNPWWWCGSANHIVSHGKKEYKKIGKNKRTQF